MERGTSFTFSQKLAIKSYLEIAASSPHTKIQFNRMLPPALIGLSFSKCFFSVRKNSKLKIVKLMKIYGAQNVLTVLIFKKNYLAMFSKISLCFKFLMST
jgi:hypothetical protein